MDMANEDKDTADMNDKKPVQRIDILQQLDDGHIDAATAMRLLEQIDQDPPAQPAVEVPAPASNMDVIEMLERGEIDVESAVSSFSNTETSSSPQAGLNTVDGRLRLLQEIDAGKVDASAAAERLEEAKEADADTNVSIRQGPMPDDLKRDSAHYKKIAMWLFGAGAILLSALGGWLASLGGWWWLFAGPCLLAGIPLIVIMVFSLKSPWVYINVHTKDDWPRRILITLPIPLKFTAWFLRTFGRHIEGLDRTVLDEILLMLEEGLLDSGPFIIEVDEGSDGERVQVYFG